MSITKVFLWELMLEMSFTSLKVENLLKKQTFIEESKFDPFPSASIFQYWSLQVEMDAEWLTLKPYRY
jgi:hypothetical protein